MSRLSCPKPISLLTWNLSIGNIWGHLEC
jgi:hypothetical protein